MIGNTRKLKALDRRLATYLTAAGAATICSTEASAVVVSNSRVRPFGVNGDVNIEFNYDGQIDYQIDHDRFNVNGTDLDFLQVDKNDISSPANPYAINPVASFPKNGTQANGDHGYMASGGIGDLGFYPKALSFGDEIGPNADNWDFQEGDGYGQSGNGIIHANRLIDEDATQIDTANSNPPANKVPTLPNGSPAFLGTGGQTKYLGVRIDLNDEGQFGLNSDPTKYQYGWIGIKITNDADATGQVTGYGFESTYNTPITAGATSPGVSGDYNGDGKVDAADYVMWRKHSGLTGGATAADGDGNGDGNVTTSDLGLWRAQYGETTSGAGAGFSANSVGVPEPGSMLLTMTWGIFLVGALVFRQLRRSSAESSELRQAPSVSLDGRFN
jgi:hypothetical protein